MARKRVAKLVEGDRIKGKGIVKEVRDFGNRIVVYLQGGGRESYGAYEEVEVEN